MWAVGLLAAACVVFGGVFVVGERSALAQADESVLPPTVADGAKLVQVYAADSFFEGPTWDPASRKLYFTSFLTGNQQILRLDGPGKVTVWLDKSEGVNGTYLSFDKRLLGAQAYGHRVMEYGFGPMGPANAQVLYHNASLNQPNDLCQTARGDIYFSDPDFKKRETSAVYLLRDGQATKVIDDMPLPNGLVASLDGRWLYVADSHEKNWRRYPIKDDGTVGPGELFFDPKTENRGDPDGMTIDEHGNLYFTGRGGVWAVDPAGKALGFIPVPEFCSNVTFGQEDGRTLYLTCSKKVYALEMKVRGSQFARNGQ